MPDSRKEIPSKSQITLARLLPRLDERFIQDSAESNREN